MAEVKSPVNGDSKPNLSAWARILSAPSSMPRLAKAVLHDTVSAWSMVDVEPPQFTALGSTRLVLGSGSVTGDDTVEAALLPFSSAAEATTSLKVDPGG